MFGDGDTGLWESGDDSLRFRIGNTDRWNIISDYISGNPTGAPRMVAAAGSAAAPVYGFKSAGVVIKSEVIPLLRKARMIYGISHTIRKYAVKNAIPPRKTTDLKT